MNPLEMVGKAGKGVGQFGAALLRGLEEYARMQARGPDYRERQRESEERSAMQRAQLELARMRTEQAAQPRRQGIKQINTPEGTKFLDLDTMQFVGPTIPLPPEAKPTPGRPIALKGAPGDPQMFMRPGSGEAIDSGVPFPPATPRQPPQSKPPDYQGRATGILKKGLVDGDATMDDLGELTRQLEEVDRFGGPPQTVGEFLERPDELNPQPGLTEGVRADPLAQDGKSLSDIVAAVKGGAGAPRLGDPDATVTVRNKEEADALPEGQIFQVEGRPEFYIKGVGEQIEQITE